MLARLCEKARAFQRLGDQVKQLLPADVAAHCEVACVDNRELVLIAPTPAWAARIRLQTSQLMDGLQARANSLVSKAQGQDSPEADCDPGFDRISVRIVPPKTENAVSRQRRQLSPAAQKALTGLAETTRNPELAAVIRRTLKHATEE